MKKLIFLIQDFYRVQKSSPLVPILSKMNPVTPLLSTPGPPKWPRSSDFVTKWMMCVKAKYLLFI
jgi:hypothetical protein